jgi:hypothetical protein
MKKEKKRGDDQKDSGEDDTYPAYGFKPFQPKAVGQGGEEI